MSKKIVNKHPLDFERTLPYFLDHIESGKTLCEKIIKKIDFREGDFFSFLASDANLNGLYEFSSGGILPPFGHPEFYINAGYPKGYQPVPNVDHECSQFIVDYLKENVKNRAFMENYNAEITDPHIDIANVKMVLYQDGICYLLNKNNSVDEVYNALRDCDVLWHLLVVLINTAALDSLEKLENNDLDLICNHANYLITSAYDGEGYIFWEKRKT